MIRRSIENRKETSTKAMEVNNLDTISSLSRNSNSTNNMFSISEMFTNKVYQLPNGKYRARIILGKFIERNGKKKWQINFKLDSGVIFEAQFPIPLNLNFGFGKAIYEVKENITYFKEDSIVNNYVFIEIKNRIINDKNYSNVSRMQFVNNEEEEI